MKVQIFVVGIIRDIILMSLFWWYWKATGDLTHARTIVFTALGIDSLLFVFSCRSPRKPIWKVNPFSNKLLLLAVVFGFGMIVVSLYIPFFQNILKTVPLNFNDWMLLVVLGFVEIFLTESFKNYYINKRKKHRLVSA
jgi:Ca2+-transporting ATPase